MNSNSANWSGSAARGGVCEVANGLDQTELDNLRAAKSILCAYRMDAAGAPPILSVDTSRLVDGLDAPRAQMPNPQQINFGDCLPLLAVLADRRNFDPLGGSLKYKYRSFHGRNRARSVPVPSVVAAAAAASNGVCGDFGGGALGAGQPRIRAGCGRR